MKTIKREQIRFRMLWQAGAIVVLAITLGGLVNQIRSDRLPLVSEISRLLFCPGWNWFWVFF